MVEDLVGVVLRDMWVQTRYELRRVGRIGFAVHESLESKSPLNAKSKAHNSLSHGLAPLKTHFISFNFAGENREIKWNI